jgi:hypothetical protein
MTGLRPRLVIDRDTSKVCMQLRLGVFTATQELPEYLAEHNLDELQSYFDTIVPEMTKELYDMRRRHLRKLKRKAAQCGSGITKLSPRSSEETPAQLPKT